MVRGSKGSGGQKPGFLLYFHPQAILSRLLLQNAFDAPLDLTYMRGKIFPAGPIRTLSSAE